MEIYKIKEAISVILNDKNNRYNSWRYCYQAFEKLESDGNDDYLALMLGFYLASWGMYRGSAGLLQKDYKVHIETIRILRRFNSLRCDSNNELTENKISELIVLSKELKKYYSNIDYLTFDEGKKKITSTDTLISKILLGTLGCSPAFDTYFLTGVKHNELKFNKISDISYSDMLLYINKYQKEIDEFRVYIQSVFDVYYPNMKILDLYFWNEGYLVELEMFKMKK